MKNSLFKTVATSALVALATTQITGSVFAYDTTTEIPHISLDKKVITPGTTSYVDNLTRDDARFGVDSDVWFKLVVKNTGNQKLTNVTVTDTVPSDLIVSDVKNGSFDGGNKVTYTIDSLETGESKELYLVGKTRSASYYTANSITCTMNYARAKGYFNNTLAEDADSAQFCIGNGTGATVINSTGSKKIGIHTIPKTGPEAGIALAIGQLALLAGGLKLRKWA